MLKKIMFGLFGFLVFAPAITFAQEKIDRTKPIGVAMMSRMNIIDAAKNAGMFHTLITAVEVAGLDKDLKGKTPYTIFAPTDEAFAKLPAETLENLLKPENKETLVKILTYHIVKGNIPAADLMKINQAKTLQGQEVKILSKDGNRTINEANIVETDVFANNGTIHVIDTVLMPK